jgi:MFS family permease
MTSIRSRPSKSNVFHRNIERIYDDLADSILVSSSRDIHLILISRFLRMFAYGSATLILAFYLEAFGFSDNWIGLFFTLTLIGDAAISLMLTMGADLVGRRIMIALGSALMMAAGVLFTLTTNYWLLLLVAVWGVISPSGNEIGPFRAIEEATLAQLSSPFARSAVFAWYTISGTTGTAFGSLLCGWFVQHLSHLEGWDKMQAHKAVYWVYAGIGGLKLILTFFLSASCEVGGRELSKVQDGPSKTPVSQTKVSTNAETEPLLKVQDDQNTSLAQDAIVKQATTRNQDAIAEHEPQRKKSVVKAKITKQTWHMLLKLLPLFAIDSFASGLVPFSLMALFIKRKFHPHNGVLGTVMSSTSFLSAASNFFVPAATKKFGYVGTMVYTHLTSSIFLLLLPFAPVFWLAIVLIAARASLSSMDQAPRSSFLSAIVTAEERNEVMGLVNVSKTIGLGLGPVLTGLMAGSGRFGWAFVLSGGLKCIYDGGLYAGFRGVGDQSSDVAVQRHDEEHLVSHLVDSEADEEQCIADRATV